MRCLRCHSSSQTFYSSAIKCKFTKKKIHGDDFISYKKPHLNEDIFLKIQVLECVKVFFFVFAVKKGKYKFFFQRSHQYYITWVTRLTKLLFFFNLKMLVRFCLPAFPEIFTECISYLPHYLHDTIRINHDILIKKSFNFFT